MNRTELAPGVAITSLPGEKFKKARFTVRLVVPGNRQTATAQALLPHVLGRRCAAIPDPTALSRRLYALYGAEISTESYTLGANRVVSIGVTGLKNAFALEGEDLEKEYVNMVCQLLFNPYLENGCFSPQDVAIEKEKQADYLRNELNEKRLYCLQQARRKLFGDSLLGIESAGYLEDIEDITPQSLYEVYRQMLAQAQIEVALFGMGQQQAQQQLQQHLSKIQRQPVAIAPAQVAPPANKLETYEEPIDALQGKLAIMCTCGKPQTAKDGAVMRLATALLGGLPTSRLFMNVREKQSLCYYCSAGYSSFSGAVTIDSGVEYENLHKAAGAILHELEEMQKTPVTEEELKDAKRALKGAFAAAQDRPSTQESWYFTEYMHGHSQTMEEFSQMLQTITAQEIQQTLATFKPAVQYALTQKEGA